MSADEGNLRLFVAIAVPDDIKVRLAALQRELRERLGRSAISWTRPENIHLTLRFLGDVQSHRVGELTSALAAAVAPLAPLRLAVCGLGCFPNTLRPRVLWAGINDEARELGVLARRIAKATESFSNQPAEERFAGHLTLARVRRIGRDGSLALDRFIQETAARALESWRAESVELVRSELHPAGSRYTTLSPTR
jgi:2'-5' RNA ligase